MTNAEKYLKDNVSVEEMIKAIDNYKPKLETSDNYFNKTIEFFNAEATPTLTEDERVILRNIDKENYFYIGRDNVLDSLYLLNDSNAQIEIDMFNHLFQFIKERRRIFY